MTASYQANMPPARLSSAHARLLHHHITLVNRSASENDDPLIALYLIFGIIGGILVLLIVAVSLLLGGCCCCHQARKVYKDFADNRRRTVAADIDHVYLYGYRSRSTNVPAVVRSQSVGARPVGFIRGEVLSDSSVVSARGPRRASLSNNHQRLLLQAPPPVLTSSGSRRSSRARSCRRSDVYSSRPKGRNQSRSPAPLFRDWSRSQRQGRYHGSEDWCTARSRSRYESREGSPRSSREGLERHASRPENYASLSSDGRPGLASY